MTCSSAGFAAPFALVVPFSEVILGSMFSVAGEMGIVSSGTGELEFIFLGRVGGADMAEVTKERRR